MCAMTSRVSQPVHAVGLYQASGWSAIANIRSASLRTTRRMVSLPSYVMAFHSLMSSLFPQGDDELRHDGPAEPPSTHVRWKSDGGSPAWVNLMCSGAAVRVTRRADGQR